MKVEAEATWRSLHKRTVAWTGRKESEKSKAWSNPDLFCVHRQDNSLKDWM